MGCRAGRWTGRTDDGGGMLSRLRVSMLNREDAIERAGVYKHAYAEYGESMPPTPALIPICNRNGKYA